MRNRLLAPIAAMSLVASILALTVEPDWPKGLKQAHPPQQRRPRAKTWTAPKAPWGDPGLQTSDGSIGTPMSRPPHASGPEVSGLLVDWDPKTFVKPFKTSSPITQEPGYPNLEYACHEGNYATFDSPQRGTRFGEKSVAAGK